MLLYRLSYSVHQDLMITSDAIAMLDTDAGTVAKTPSCDIAPYESFERHVGVLALCLCMPGPLFKSQRSLLLHRVRVWRVVKNLPAKKERCTDTRYERTRDSGGSADSHCNRSKLGFYSSGEGEGGRDEAWACSGPGGREFGLYFSVSRKLAQPCWFLQDSLLESLLPVLFHSLEATGDPGASMVCNISRWLISVAESPDQLEEFYGHSIVKTRVFTQSFDRSSCAATIKLHPKL